MNEDYKGFLILAGAILAIIVGRYFWKKTPKLSGAKNKERWQLIRDESGTIQELIVNRDLKE